MTNVCGAGYPTDLRHVEKWSSSCVTSAPMDGTGGGGAVPTDVILTWAGHDLDHLHAKLVRYRRVVVSLPTPADQVNPVENYDLIASTTMEGGGLTWTSNRSLTLRCQRKKSRCDVARVPEDLLAETSSSNAFRFSLLSVPASLAAGAAEGAVGVAYQRSVYTIATLVWRYVLLLLSFLHTLRFIAFRKYTSTLYEQAWTLALQVALLWYLNPLFALNITIWPMPAVLAFMEYRIPTYFMAVLIAYMLSVMTASMAWPTHAGRTTPPSVVARAKAFLLRSHNVYDPPKWTKIIVFLYLVCVFVLVIVDACVEEFDWYAASNSYTRFARLYWAAIALLLFGGLVCVVLLMYLRSYLGNKPYLESRPQQLACRVFLMIFLSAVVYYVIHCLVFFLLYNHDFPVVASHQPFLQLPTLMVASFFVNIMTFVYTSQNRDDNVPINPKDSRWKHMVWPDSWYRWLARHGGSQYIFSTEVEETRFYRLQFEFRKRQFMARQKRKQQQPQRSGAGAGGNGNEDSALYERSTSLGTQREATHSGFFSLFRTHNAMSGRTTRRASREAAATRGGGGGEALWRTDVWQTPMPSQPPSPLSSDVEGSDGEGIPSQPPARVYPNSFAATGAMRGAPGEGRRRVGRDAGNRPNRWENPDAPNTTNVSFLPGPRNSSFARPRDAAAAAAAANVTSVNLAARSVLNMDRFSTYFLADGGNGVANTDPMASAAGPGNSGSGGGGYARRPNSRLTTPSQSPQREPGSAFDAFAVEGPARHRSRLLQGTSTARRHDNAGLRREQTMTVAENQIALSRTFAGFEGRPRYAPQTEHVSTPLVVGEGLRSGACHARSRSAGSVAHSNSAHANYDAERSSPPIPPPQRQHQRYRDPVHESTRAASTTAGTRPKGGHGDEVRPTRRSPRGPSTSNNNEETEDPCYSGSIDVTDEATAGTAHARQSEALLQALRQVQQYSFASPADTLRRGPHALPTFAATPTTAQPVKHASGNDGNGEGAHAKRRRAPAPLASTATGHRSFGAPPTDVNAASTTLLDDMASDLSQPTSEEEDGAHYHSDDDGDDGHGRGRRSFFHTLNVVRERLGAAMGAAEKHLFEKPARNLDRFETHIFDAAYRPFQSMHYLPFFNLETAIDCFNVSWEAYGVEKSGGDDAIETGIKMTPQNVPKTVAHGVKKVVCGCCPAEDDSSQDEEDSSEDENAAGTGGNDRVVRYLQASGHYNASSDHVGSGEGEQRQDSTSAAVPPAPGGRQAASTVAQAEQHEMLPRHASATGVDGDKDGDKTLSPLHHAAVHDADDAVVIVHMTGEGEQNNVPTAERAPQAAASQPKRPDKEGSNEADADAVVQQTVAAAAAGELPSRGLAQGGPVTTVNAPSSNPAVPTTSTLFPIDVEKYGFTLLLVAEAKEVQVIMVKMDTNAPEHRGKAPRIIIGFRGTANMSNAKYDMNIHRVVWREMERVEAEDNQNGSSGVPTDMASTLDGGSTMGTQHLGCAACLRSCARATSWRPTCHAGFLVIWKTLKPTVMQRLRAIVEEDRNIVYRIFTTGHSLGGALASLSAYSITAVLRRMDYPIPEVTVYTYGQPRMGNRTFQRIYNKAVPRSFSVVNESDVVVSMTTFGGYHVGIEVDVDRNGNFIVKPTEIEKLFPPTAGRGMTVINHLMANYGVSLNAIASRTTCPARGLACYSTADPEKIAREKAKEDAVRQLQDAKKQGDAGPRGQ
ncbi:putative lipase domain protein [Leptomonas pyrrhocoris]|uniref:Putative lipase domain protein n=1 Tax=Leptomonas pyrrhocoris TaxID=157538 RepID=A0A0N0VF83_LEPPY|nr:putative lipase domain protein [Leptomonas pyrrhocoris]KPA80501.1 putative lipase domain protein [Leptomonas pyrrhocoris]|eukprot:XP_015658940.1 putative lipase domain protein [Leptomonas pyrrhocoris]